jgi:hypothetical protein
MSADYDRFESITGEQLNPPQYFNGLSGTSIWQSWWKDEDESTNWKSKKLKVVGVDTGHYRAKKLIKATCWRIVALIIMKCYKEHHLTFDLHFPGILEHHLKFESGHYFFGGK